MNRNEFVIAIIKSFSVHAANAVHDSHDDECEFFVLAIKFVAECIAEQTAVALQVPLFWVWSDLSLYRSKRCKQSIPASATNCVFSPCSNSLLFDCASHSQSDASSAIELKVWWLSLELTRIFQSIQMNSFFSHWTVDEITCAKWSTHSHETHSYPNKLPLFPPRLRLNYKWVTNENNNVRTHTHAH